MLKALNLIINRKGRKRFYSWSQLSLSLNPAVLACLYFCSGSVFPGLDLLVPMKVNLLILQLYFRQQCSSSFLLPQDTKQLHEEMVFPICLLLLTTVLCRALTSTPSKTFGMNLTIDCEPDLNTKHQCCPTKTETRRVVLHMGAIFSCPHTFGYELYDTNVA